MKNKAQEMREVTDRKLSVECRCGGILLAIEGLANLGEYYMSYEAEYKTDVIDYLKNLGFSFYETIPTAYVEKRRFIFWGDKERVVYQISKNEEEMNHIKVVECYS
jgi:hypothetical protein